MSTLKEFSKELMEESAVTRKMLALVPEEHYDWKPHVKSMSLRQLAGHLAELPGWITMAFTTTELDFAASGYVAPVWNSAAELMAIFEPALRGALADLDSGREEDLDPQWLLRNGEQVLVTFTRRELVRHTLSQTIHHRAQLGVFLRLLDIPIPGSYGPSADDQNFS